MEINGSDPFIKKSFYTEKKNQKEKINTRDLSGSRKESSRSVSRSTDDIRELQANVQKSILKSEVLIGGLENLKALSDSTDDPDEKNRMLKEIITKTVFENKPVLQEYADILNSALRNEDVSTIDNIILAEKENIRNSSSKEQNIISIGSSLHQQDAELLLQSIIRQLKENGEPEMNLPVNKVLDLLKE